MFTCTKIKGVEYYLAMGSDAAQALGMSPHEVDADSNQRDYVDYLADNGAGQSVGKWMRFTRPSDGPSLPSHFVFKIFALCVDGAEVSGRVLRDLAEGKDPSTGKVVARRKRLKKGEPTVAPGGYDMQMSQGKSLSVAALLLYAGGNAAGVMDSIQDRALRKAYQWAWDRDLFVTRKDGVLQPVREIALGTFKHSTSRAEDPHSHIHAALMKTAIGMDGSIVQLDNYLLKKYAGSVGAIYRCEEARLVKEELGLALERSGRNYEIAGFPPDIITLFSKRRAEIEKLARARGVTTAEARQVAQVLSFNSREGKVFTELGELRDRWDRELATKGWDRASILSAIMAAARLANKAAPEEDESRRRPRMDRLVMKAVNVLMENNAVFTQATLYRAAFEAMQTEGVGADEAFAIVKHLEASGQIVRIPLNRPEPVYTTEAMIGMEKEVVRITVARIAERDFIDEEFARNFIAQRREIRDESGAVIKRGLNLEQAAAVLHAAGRDGQTAIQGAAGTGKSFSTRVTKELFEAQGYTTYGCAPSWKAANVLRVDAGLDESRVFATAKILNLMVAKGELRLDGKSLLIVDEAGMVGTADFLQLQQLCQKAGAKLLLQGDALQFGSVSAGAPFSLANRVSKPAPLVDIQRQTGTTKAEGEWMRAASVDFSKGDPASTIRALEAYDRHGMVRWCEDGDAAISALIDAYMADRLATPAKSQGITTQWNVDGQKIATAIRLRLREENLLSEEAIEIVAIPRGARARAKSLELSVGDDIVFGESVKLETTAIRNNDLARIVAINTGDGTDPVLSMVMDDGREIVARVSELVGSRAEPGKEDDADEAEPHVPKMQHAYAMTGHGFQGCTVDRHYDIVLNSRGAQGTYVCATRHREQFRMFVDCERIADALGTTTPGVMSVRRGRLVSTPEQDDMVGQPTLNDIRKRFFAEASGKDEFGNVADHIGDDKLLVWAGIEQLAPVAPIQQVPSSVAAVRQAISTGSVSFDVTGSSEATGSTSNQEAPSPALGTAPTTAQAMKDRMEHRKSAPKGYRAHYRSPDFASAVSDLTTTGVFASVTTPIQRRALIMQAEQLWRRFARGANEYLIKVRGIAPDILRRFSNDIRTTGSGAAVFAHRDLDSRITGFEYEGTTMQVEGKRRVSFFGKGGEKNFTQIGQAKAPTRIYITGSAVDTLSLYQHDGAPEGALLASFAGHASTQELDRFTEFVRRNPQAEVHLGSDAGKSGQGFSAEMKRRLVEVRGEKGYAVRDPSENSHRQFNDWNDRLKNIDSMVVAALDETLAARLQQEAEAAGLKDGSLKSEAEASKDAPPSLSPPL